MNGIQNILKAISKSIGNEITEDMDLLKVIGKVTDNKDVKSIVNSMNSNQTISKEWLIDNLKDRITMFDNPKICVAAGWYGNLADRLSEFTNEKVVSFDIDPKCEKIGRVMYPNVHFKTVDINNFHPGKYDVIICTSCEHFNDDILNDFLSKRNKEKCLVILQSNNYKELDEHVNCKSSLEEFEKSVRLRVLNSSEKRINNKFNRYMVIGY